MPNKVYRAIETAIVFTDTTGDQTLVLNNLASDTGRYSVRVDRGTGSKPYRYMWKAVIQWNVAPTVGDVAEIFIIESDGTYNDGVVGNTGGTFTSGQALNIKQVGVVRAQTASAATNFISSGECHIFDRYFAVGVFNRSAQSLQATNNVSRVILTPIPDEIQD